MKIFIIILLIFLDAGFIGAKEIKEETGDKKLIICMRKESEFKNAIVDKIKERYGTKNKIETVKFKRIKKLKNCEPDAILIIDTYMAGALFNGKIKKFIKKSGLTEKAAILMTFGDPEKKFSYKGVDAVSSASKEENHREVFKELIGKLDKLLD